jgi:acetyl esterase/lipase
MRAATWSDGPPRGTTVEEITLGGVRALRLTPPATGDGVLLYFHGGGYAVGAPETHRGFIGRVAQALGAHALAPAYRLAPEHPYPAALEDARAFYDALLAEGTPASRVVVAGDSAGGDLTLALAMSLRDAGAPLPAALGLICPWLDPWADLARSRRPAPREPILNPGLMNAYALAYLGDHDVSDPGVTLLSRDLGGLPPIVLHSCGDDLVAADARALAQRAAEAGAELEHREYEGLWHDVHLQAYLLSGIGDPVGELAASLRAHLARPAVRTA